MRAVLRVLALLAVALQLAATASPAIASPPAAPPSVPASLDLTGRWDGTFTIVSVSYGEPLKFLREKNKPYPQSFRLKADSPTAGKLDGLGTIYEIEGGSYTFDGVKLGGSHFLGLGPIGAHFQMDVTLDTAGEQPVFQGTWRMWGKIPATSGSGSPFGGPPASGGGFPQLADVDARGTTRLTKVGPLPAAFTYAPAVPKPGDTVTVTDQTVLPAGAKPVRQWSVDGVTHTATAASWTWQLPDDKRHRIKLTITDDATKRSGTVEHLVPNGKALCAAALAYFKQSGANLVDSNLAMDATDLQLDFESAVQRFAAEHPQQAPYVTWNASGTLAIGSWLFAYGGVADYWSSKMVALPAGQADEIKKALQRQAMEQQRGNDSKTIVPAGTEPALMQDIVAFSKAQGRTLTPGDILYLAMKQRGGDASAALLLAHNTLRSLARDGDSRFTGIDRDPSFFTKYLRPIRDGADQGGPYYHLFGTAYFEAMNRGSWNPINFLPNLPIVQPVLEEVASLAGYETDSSVDLTMTSWAANWKEQSVRQSSVGGSQSADPEKFCVNIWGANLGAWLYNGGVHSRFPAPPATVPQEVIENWDKEVELVGGATFSGKQVKVVYSPVSVTWEGNGYRMVLDQKTGSVYGYYPVVLLPFYEEKIGTWGVAWVDVLDAPYSVTLEGSQDGEAHLLVADPLRAQTALYAAKVHTGEILTVALDPQSVGGAMTAKDGRTVQPVLGALTPKPPADYTGAALVAVAGVVALVIARRRRGRKAPARAAGPGAVRVAATAAPPRAAAPRRFCASCGAPLSPTARFCPKCGGAAA